MLQTLRRRQGPMLIFVLILLIVSFVFMTDYGAGTFNLGTTLFKIEEDSIDTEEALKFAYERLGISGIQPDMDAMNRAIQEELNSPTRNEGRVEQLKSSMQENSRKIAATAAYMAADRVIDADGIRVTEAAALESLRKNRYLAYQVFQRHYGAFDKGEPLPAEAKLALKRYIFEYSKHLHSRLYSTCLGIPASLSHAGLDGGQGSGGWRKGALAAEAGLVRLSLHEFSSLKVTGDGSETTSEDATALERFYMAHKESEPRDGRPGYTLPADIDVICLYATSADHVAAVKTNPVILRQHYEANKRLWLAPKPEAPAALDGVSMDSVSADEPVALPFMDVRASVERHYRWTQAEVAARKVLELARSDWRSGTDFSEVLRNHRVKYVSFDGLKRREIDSLPSFSNAEGLEDAFSASAGAFSEDVRSFEKGPYLWHVTAKQKETVIDLESQRPAIRLDLRRSSQLQAAVTALTAYASAFDASKGDAAAATLAMQAEVKRLIGSELGSPPSPKPLGLIRAGDKLDEMTGHEDMTVGLFHNLATGRGATSGVDTDSLSGDALLLVSTNHKLMPTDTSGLTFAEHFRKNGPYLADELAGPFWGNPWLMMLYEQKVKMLVDIN